MAVVIDYPPPRGAFLFARSGACEQAAFRSFRRTDPASRRPIAAHLSVRLNRALFRRNPEGICDPGIALLRISLGHRGGRMIVAPERRRAACNMCLRRRHEWSSLRLRKHCHGYVAGLVEMRFFTVSIRPCIDQSHPHGCVDDKLS